MQEKKEVYRGKEIIIEGVGGHEGHEHGSESHSLSINGEHIHIMRSGSKFASHYLPYEDYDSELELAKAIIDKVPAFKQIG